MTGRERVLTAIQHRQPDRVPKGELLIDEGLFLRLARLLGLGDSTRADFTIRLRVLQALGIDLVCLPLPGEAQPRGESPSVESSIELWAGETDFFVFALVDGGFGAGVKRFGWMEFLAMPLRDPGTVASFLGEHATRAGEMIQRAVEKGAHGIMLADDIAYHRGTFWSPRLLQSLYFPFLAPLVAAARRCRVPLFFHADGDLRAILPDLAGLGLDGLHSLEPTAGMDLAEIKKAYGSRLCLMGNLDLALLAMPGATPRIAREVRKMLRAGAPGGGYIFGSSGGLMEGLPEENVVAMYRAVGKFGQYPRVRDGTPAAGKRPGAPPPLPLRR